MKDTDNPFRTDRVLVEKMWEGNNDAWEYILRCTVIPMCREEFYYRIITDRNLSQYDVLGMLFDLLIVNKKLATFQFKCPLFLWLRFYVRKAILDFCRKNREIVSDPMVISVLSGAKEKEPLDKEKEIAQMCFSELWKQNPKRAYVLLLKANTNMSARGIMKILSISSEDNVHQLHSRATADMREIRNRIISEDLR